MQQDQLWNNFEIKLAFQISNNYITLPIYNSSDADAPILTDYVIALLRKHGDRDTVESECSRELQAFMGDNTPKFVAKLSTSLR